MTDERRWLELRVRVADGDDRASLVVEALVEAGARGAIESPDGSYVAYVEEPEDPDVFVEVLRREVSSAVGGAVVEVEHGWQDHEEWAETWKRGLGPRRITPRLIVHPSWTTPEDVRPGDLVIVLDPGMAFGTAEHGTTRGCLRLLDTHVGPGDRVLDVGAGSGVLSIAAVLMGASEVEAVDGDPYACEAMVENAALNRVAHRVSIAAEWLSAASLVERGQWNGVIANIETGLLLPLLPGLTGAVDGGGWLLLSGILAQEWTGVVDAMHRRGFRPAAVDADGIWRSGIFRRAS